MIANPTIPYDFKLMPEGWATVIDRQVYSRSWSITIAYKTPRYTGTIVWSGNDIYGELAGCFDWNGECLQASAGHSIYKYLNIPETYLTGIGKDGWDKFITREYFELWLKQDLPIAYEKNKTS